MNFLKFQTIMTSSLMIITLFACQTIEKDSPAEKRKKEILDTQKSLVVSFINKGMPHLALKELRVLVRKNPKEPDLLNLMGLTQLSLNNPKVAIDYFKRSYKEKESIPVALNLSSAYINLRKYKKAVFLLKKTQKTKVYQDYSYPERINHNIALAYEKSNQNKLAIKYYKQALSYNPVYYLSLMRLGELYRRNGKVKTSMKYFYRAKTSCAVCYDPIRSLSYNYIALGSPKKAIPLVKNYLKVKEISPKNKYKGNKLLKYTRKSISQKSRTKKSNSRKY